LISHDLEGEYSKMAPFRILSFDIECAGREGHFPEPSHDPVVQVPLPSLLHLQISTLCYYFWSENSHFFQIANSVTLQGEDQPLIRNVMTLKSCSPIVGVDVMSYDTEREVLLAWRVISLCAYSCLYLSSIRISAKPPIFIHYSP